MYIGFEQKLIRFRMSKKYQQLEQPIKDLPQYSIYMLHM